MQNSIMINYQVLRSRRKTLALQVKQGLVFVRAPYHLDDKFISTFIQKKEAWLKAKIFEQNQTVDYCCAFTQGSRLLVFGQLVTLDIIFANLSEKLSEKLSDKLGTKSDTYLSALANGNQVLTIVLPARIKHKRLNKAQLAIVVKKQIEHYFKQQAHQLILPRVEYYSKLIQLSPKTIKIRQYRARWGSCNSRGELSFNYLLMMLPKHVIDYVVVHELCHLRYLNHSSYFWQLVTQYCPDYFNAKRWLKANQSALAWRTPSVE